MKYTNVFTVTVVLLLASSASSAEPMISTDKLTPLNPTLQQPIKQKSLPDTHKRAITPLTTARVRPTHAEHSARPNQNWCTTRNASTIQGRVSLKYNYPGPSDGPQLPGVIVVYSNGREYRTNVTVYPGIDKTAISDFLPFGWRDACPPSRIGVRLLARNPADRSKFMPVTIYARPDRADRPDWY